MSRKSSPVFFVLFLTLLVTIGFLLVYEHYRSGSTGQTSSPINVSPVQPTLPEITGNQSRGNIPFGAPKSQTCMAIGVSCGSDYFGAWREPAKDSCHTSIRNGYPVPDPHCTPGGVNPTVSQDTLVDDGWSTRCIRNCETSEADKHEVYAWYGIPSPAENHGRKEVCELDHLVPLELGGSDGLANIWPQCGPDGVALQKRYFRIKDRVENYLAREVKAGRMPLEGAQKGIAEDWTQYLMAAGQ